MAIPDRLVEARVARFRPRLRSYAAFMTKPPPQSRFHMRSAADSEQQKQQVGEAQMRVIPCYKPCNKEFAVDGAASGHQSAADSDSPEPEPSGFWRRFADAIDSLAAYPVKHALSDRELEHVDAEIERCRQLMSGRRPRRSAAVVPFRSQPHRVLVPVKVRP